MPTDNQVLEQKRFEGLEVRKIVVFHDARDHITGLQFFNQQGDNICTAGTCNYVPYAVELVEGERVIGVKSRRFNPTTAKHTSF